MNLTERAEIRRETFYKLTNSAIAPEVPGGSRNLLRNSKSFTGSNITGSSKLLNENYNGYAVRYIKATEWAEIAQFSNCTVPKVNSIYTASFWAKGSGKIRAYFYGNPHYLEVLDGSSNQNGRTTAPDGAIDFTVTSEWKRYWVTYTLKSSFPSSDTTVAKHFLLRHLKSTSEEEFWVAGCKLEERNIADSCSQAPEDFGWTMDTITPTQSNRYLWKFDYIYYSDNSVEITPVNNLSVAGREETHRDVTFWHGLSATKHPSGIYDCLNRDHIFANEFNVVSGKKYTVRFIAQRTKGTINPKGGIWYTERSSGYQFDGLAALTLVTDLSEDGLGVWERTLTVPDGKTKGKVYIQLEQSSTTGYTTAYRIYDALVFDENGNQLITTEVTNQPSTGCLTTPMAATDGTYI